MNDRNDQAKAYADAARLMTQPLAGAAVLGALGIGMATQAFGLWLTAVSGAMRAGHDAAHAGASPDRDRRSEASAKQSASPVAGPVAETPSPVSAKVVRFVPRAERAAKAPKPNARKANPGGATAQPVASPAGPKAPAARADDLKAIGGIGPKLETVLNGLGFRTYAQIASMTAEQIALVEDRIGFPGRIVRDDWTGQAKAFLTGGAA